MIDRGMFIRDRVRWGKLMLRVISEPLAREHIPKVTLNGKLPGIY